MYDTVDEARMRLAGTIVLYRGEPRYVRDCVPAGGGEIMLQIDSLPNFGNGAIVSIRDPDLNAKDYRSHIGYMNNISVDGGQTFSAHYIMRMPVRGDGFKQGLHGSNLLFPRAGAGRIKFSNAIAMPSFKDMMIGEYPSLQETREILDGNHRHKSVAFNRVFALAKDHELGFYVLWYKGKRVARGDPDSLVLPSHNYYLSELLRESGISVR